jgi:glycosyltransferase involved in cell wall biosynthesis
VETTLQTAPAPPEPDALPTVSIVMPAFNEGPNLPAVLTPLLDEARRRHWEVLVVDDGSADDTAAVAARCGATVVSHPRNRGYGAALKTGIRAATAPFVATMDSDGQHTLEALDDVLAHAGDADLVVGARSGLRQSPLWRMPGKWVLQRLATFIARQPIPDLNSGLRVFRREVILRYIHLCPDGFSFSTTSTLAFLNRGRSVEYVPIQIKPRGGHSTVSMITGFDALLLILRLATLFEPLRLFVSAGLMLFGAGILWAIPYAAAGRGISLGAGLLVLTAVQLLFTGLVADQIASLRKERYE